MDLSKINEKSTKKRQKKEGFTLQVQQADLEFIQSLDEVGKPHLLGAGEIALQLGLQPESKKYYIVGFSTQNPNVCYAVQVESLYRCENKSINILHLEIPDAKIPNSFRDHNRVSTLIKFYEDTKPAEEEETETEEETEETAEEEERQRKNVRLEAYIQAKREGLSEKQAQSLASAKADAKADFNESA